MNLSKRVYTGYLNFCHLWEFMINSNSYKYKYFLMNIQYEYKDWTQTETQRFAANDHLLSFSLLQFTETKVSKPVTSS